MAITRGEHVFVNGKWRFEFVDQTNEATRFMTTYNCGANRKDTKIIAIPTDSVAYTSRNAATIAEPLLRDALGANFAKLYTIKTAEDVLRQAYAVYAFEEEEMSLPGTGFIDLGLLSPKQLVLLNNLEVHGTEAKREEIAATTKQLDVPFENLSAHLAIACAEREMRGQSHISCNVDSKPVDARVAKAIGNSTFRSAASAADLLTPGHRAAATAKQAERARAVKH